MNLHNCQMEMKEIVSKVVVHKKKRELLAQIERKKWWAIDCLKKIETENEKHENGWKRSRHDDGTNWH
jgi:hypothetical protein